MKPLALSLPPAWTAEAACAQTDPDLFFPDQGRHDAQTAAKRVCRTCPVATPCLIDVLKFERGYEQSSRHGIWAGLTPRERAKLDRGAA